MAEKRKSIIEDFLLEAKSLEDALKANTKEMLAAHLSKEIESIVESSLKKGDEKEKMSEEEEDIELDDLETKGSDDEQEVKLDLNDEDEESQFGDEESEEESIDLDLDALDLYGDEEEGGESDDELKLDLPVDLGGEDESFGDLEVRDLTKEPTDKVLSVFKSMKDTDEVEVVKDEDGIHLTDHETGAEYYIKESEEKGEYCSECGSGSMYEDEEHEDELVYEIELDEEMYEMVKGVKEGAYIDEEEEEEEEILEDKIRRHRADGKQRYTGARLASGRGSFDESRRNRKPMTRTEKTNTVSESKMMKEYKELKAKNEEYKNALNVFKDKLNEVALFNTNLAYVNRLFTEHSTTKKEKMDILKRFDGAESIKESKNIYKAIKTELENKTPITESIQNKVNKTVKSSNVTNLNESTAYVDPQITAIKDLMRRIS